MRGWGGGLSKSMNEGEGDQDACLVGAGWSGNMPVGGELVRIYV